MEQKKTLQNWIMVFVAISPVIYLATIWSNIPAIIPQHYDGHFKPDAYGSKSFLIWPSIFLPALAIGIYFLFKNIHRIDPLRYGSKKNDGLVRLGIGLVVFMTILTYIIILTSAKNVKILDRVILPFVGLLLAFIGNYMQNLKPNYFAGIRIPWTLSSEQNWRKTHQMAGKLWFWGGLFIALITVVVPASVSEIIMLATVAVLVIIPIRFSFLLFKQEKNNT